MKTKVKTRLKTYQATVHFRNAVSRERRKTRYVVLAFSKADAIRQAKLMAQYDGYITPTNCRFVWGSAIEVAS